MTQVPSAGYDNPETVRKALTPFKVMAFIVGVGLLVLVLAILVQVGVGIWQAREGLPPLLVGIHMVLASLSAAAYTVVVLRLKRPVPVDA